MSDDNVIRVKNDLYLKAKDLAQSENISLADAVSKLVESGGVQPSACELLQFRSVLEDRGLTPPKRADWVWGITNILPPEMLVGTKLQPYAEARLEAEHRCSVADELYDKLVEELGSEEAVEKALDEAAKLEATEPEASLPIETSLKAEAGGETEAESTPPAEAEQAEQPVAESVESIEQAEALPEEVIG